MGDEVEGGGRTSVHVREREALENAKGWMTKNGLISTHGKRGIYYSLIGRGESLNYELSIRSSNARRGIFRRCNDPVELLLNTL